MLREQLGERLIEEAGANFEAPVAVPFSNKPVRGEPEPRPEVDERPKIVRDGVQGRIGEGGLIKGRRRERDRDGDRTKALSKLDHQDPTHGRRSRRTRLKKEGLQEGCWLQERVQSPAFDRARRQGQARRTLRPAESAHVQCVDGAGRKAARQEERRRIGQADVPVARKAASRRARPSRAAANQVSARARAVRIVGGEFRGRPLQRRAAIRSARPPTARARRCSTSCRTASPTNLTARACSTCSRAPARWAWRRCRAARPSACSSKNWPKAAA